MKHFEHINPASIEEASFLLENGNAKLMAGGTDLLGELKEQILPEYPDQILNLKSVPGLDYINEEEDGIHIGALTKLCDITQSSLLTEKMPAVAQAAGSVASPLIRNSATVGGNLFQEVRCWYYRCASQMGGAIECARKGGAACYASAGESKYHSIFGAAKVGTTPCTAKCPAGVDIPAYMERLRSGDVAGAARILLRNNPIPCITSRVCTHFCQEGCNRSQIDERVGVGQVERYLGDYILDHASQLMPAPESETGRRIAIVGSGPAGLSAAFYLRQAGHQVTVYEKMPEAGGLLMYAIPAYRLPKEVVRRLIGALTQMGIDFKCSIDVGNDIPMNQLAEEYDKVFLAPGAWKKTVIGMDGEDMTRFGLEFLVEVKGWMQNKPGSHVVVVGGGNVAVDVAVTAKRLGAERVTMVSLESRRELPATKEELERAEEEGICLMDSWGPVAVIRDGASITGIKLRRCLSVRDADGRFSPSYNDEDTTIVESDSILLCVGQQTDLSFLGDEFELEQNRGRIAVHELTQCTSNENVYAGGDVVTGPATAVGAIAAGRRAAEQISAVLEQMNEVPEQTNAADKHTNGHRPNADKLLTFAPTAAQYSRTSKLHIRPLKELAVDLEDDFGLNPEEVSYEADRCLNCGCLAVNPSDLATVLVCLDADIVTNKRRVSAKDLFCRPSQEEHFLQKGEIMIELILPLKGQGWITSYDKFRDRKTIDFATVGLACAYRLEHNIIQEARIVMGAVAPVPLTAAEAQTYLTGKSIDEEIAEQAAELALKDALPKEDNKYKVNITKALIKRSLLRCIG